jgi:hypothetical protein
MSSEVIRRDCKLVATLGPDDSYMLLPSVGVIIANPQLPPVLVLFGSDGQVCREVSP